MSERAPEPSGFTRLAHVEVDDALDGADAGKRRVAGDTARQATSPEVKEVRAEAAALLARGCRQHLARP